MTTRPPFSLLVLPKSVKGPQITLLVGGLLAKSCSYGALMRLGLNVNLLVDFRLPPI